MMCERTVNNDVWMGSNNDEWEDNDNVWKDMEDVDVWIGKSE